MIKLSTQKVFNLSYFGVLHINKISPLLQLRRFLSSQSHTNNNKKEGKIKSNNERNTTSNKANSQPIIISTKDLSISSNRKDNSKTKTKKTKNEIPNSTNNTQKQPKQTKTIGSLPKGT